MFKYFAILTIAIFGYLANSATASEISPQDLYRELQRQNWPTARVIAIKLDAQHTQGDIFVAFADSVELSKTGQCQKAVQLSSAIIKAVPDFIPSYHILATCLVGAGQKLNASRVYKKLAHNLSPGPDQDAAFERARVLAGKRKPAFSFEFEVRPSSNANHQTTATRFGGNTITPGSRAKAGVSLSTFGTLELPIFEANGIYTSFKGKLGGNYNSSRAQPFFPGAGLSTRTTMLITPELTIYAEPFVQRTWSKKAIYLTQFGITMGFNKQVSPSTALFGDFGFTKHDYETVGRDATLLSAKVSYTTKPLINDRFSLSLGVRSNDAASKTVTYVEPSISAGWEHRFEQGLITNLSVVAGGRFYEGFAPLTTTK